MEDKEIKRQSNIEVITELMEFGNPLKQVFIMQAVEQYAEAVGASTPEELDTSFISGQAWHDCAAEIKAKLDEHFGGHS